MVAFVGAAMIAIAAGASLSGGTGILMVLAATFLWAVYLVIQKTLAGRYDSLELTAWPMWIGAVLLLPFAVGLPRAVATAPLVSTAAVVFLGAFCSVAAFMTWAYAIRRLARHRRDFGAVRRTGRCVRDRHRVPERDAAAIRASRRSDRDRWRGARATQGPTGG